MNLNQTPIQDPFQDVLNSLKVSGQVLLVDAYLPPWGIVIPNGKAIQKLLSLPVKTKVVPFHMVRKGQFELHLEHREPEVVRDGQIAICLPGDSHQMIQGTPEKMVHFSDLLQGEVNPIDARGHAGTTELVCGIFLLQNSQFNPLLAALPDVLKMDVSGRNGGKTLELLSQLLVTELHKSRAGHGYMAERIVELLCAEAIRQYMDEDEEHRQGWFNGIKDPKIGQALHHIHQHIQHNLTVTKLAEIVGMSETRFAAKFKSLMGCSVMAYVAQWRMNTASRMLSETDLKLDNIATKIGYESTASFSRAFSKFYQMPPAQWRKQ